MVDRMRAKTFLSHTHRNSLNLRNEVGEKVEDLRDNCVQKRILNIEEHGKKIAELHASAMFLEVFEAVSGIEITEHFGGQRFKGEWRKLRKILTAGAVMASHTAESDTQLLRSCKDPRRAISERRYVFQKLMNSLPLAEHAALRGGDFEEAENARRRWEVIQAARYLLSPFPVAHCNCDSTVRHGKKSQVLSALNMDFMEDSRNNLHTAVCRPNSSRTSLSFFYDYHMSQYAAVMVEVMNHVWNRGTDGQRGNSVLSVTVLKMKHLLSSWFSGRRSKGLQQLHLHIYDPTNVISQNYSGQARRDTARNVNNIEMKLGGEDELYKNGFQVPMSAPWSTLISSMTSRDAICPLHLFCGAVAAMELGQPDCCEIIPLRPILGERRRCQRGSTRRGRAARIDPIRAISGKGRGSLAGYA